MGPGVNISRRQDSPGATSGDYVRRCVSTGRNAPQLPCPYTSRHCRSRSLAHPLRPHPTRRTPAVFRKDTPQSAPQCHCSKADCRTRQTISPDWCPRTLARKRKKERKIYTSVLYIFKMVSKKDIINADVPAISFVPMYELSISSVEIDCCCHVVVFINHLRDRVPDW